MLPLRLACWDYDRTRPLIDGRVSPAGVALDVSVMRPREAFRRMFEEEAFDVAEVSLASFVRLVSCGDARFVGLPVPLSRMFRHSCIYVRSASGIKTPGDLAGRRVGVSQLDSTGIVHIKGMLQDDYALRPTDPLWVLGGLETPLVDTPLVPTGHGQVYIERSDSLVGLIERGSIDALLSNHIPSTFHVGSAVIHRLFPDYKHVEQDYFRRTSIFPIMHLVVVRRELCDAHPWLAQSLIAAFEESRSLAVAGLYDTDALRLSLPWLIDHIEEARAQLGDNFWPYGKERNRSSWAAVATYMHTQQLIARTVHFEELFSHC